MGHTQSRYVRVPNPYASARIPRQIIQRRNAIVPPAIPGPSQPPSPPPPAPQPAPQPSINYTPAPQPIIIQPPNNNAPIANIPYIDNDESDTCPYGWVFSIGSCVLSLCVLIVFTVFGIWFAMNGRSPVKIS